MASKRKNGGRRPGLSSRVDLLEQCVLRLEVVQRDTSTRLGRIEDTLATASKLFELMNGRLEALEEGQKVTNARLEAMDGRLEALEEGQRLIVDRLDRLVEAATRDRTATVERVTKLEVRVDALERQRA